jgi:hypothetical protein
MDKIAEFTIERGRKALARIHADPDFTDWQDWIIVAAALEVGVELCTREARAKSGIRYNRAMGAWLKATGFDAIDQGARSRLLDCMKHLAEVETWRRSLEPHQRRRKNHPNAVWHGWRGR